MGLSAAKRFLRRRGQDVPLRTYTKNGKDDHGDQKWAASTRTVRAYRSSSPRGSGHHTITNTLGKQSVVTAEIMIAEDETVSTKNVDKPPEVDMDGFTFQVLAVKPRQLGYNVLQVDTKR